MTKLTEPQKSELRVLHAEGMTDPEIGRLLGYPTKTICYQRRRLGLLPNAVQGGRRASSDKVAAWPDLKRRCIALLRRGVGSRLIARESGASVKSLERWRTEMLRENPALRRPGTGRPNPPHRASGRPYSALRSDRRARAFALYADGLNDREIANAMGLNTPQVWEWRKALVLPPVERRTKQRPPKHGRSPAITPLSNRLYRHIAEAVGGGLAPDIRDDVISEVWLRLQEGGLSADRVAAEASECRKRVLREFANPFGPRSLDEKIGDEDGLRMIDLLPDERSPSWLEEMGATVW